jgi:hypothetical protein
MRPEHRKLAGTWAAGAGLGLIVALLMPWVDRSRLSDVIGVDASDLWWILGVIGIGITAIGISLLSSRRSANALGWALLIAAFVALAVVLIGAVDALDVEGEDPGNGLNVAIFAAGAAAADAFVLLVRAKRPPPATDPSVPPPPI